MVKRALTLLTSLLIALPLLMPFNIYANQEIQIVPTWSQSAQKTQWANKFRVTNYCESSNNPQNYSCQLTITVNGDYYGYVYFDGYINNQIIFDYQTIFISGGKGTFYYTWYQNGLKEINKVNIAGLSLVQPTDNVDLTQIIDILTSINSYNQQIEGNQDNEIQELQTVINNLIVSNGYLQTITKLRQYQIPIESFPFVHYCYRNIGEPVTINNGYFTMPLFALTPSIKVPILRRSGNLNQTGYCIFGIDGNFWDLNSFKNALSSTENCEIIAFENINRLDYIPNFTIVKLTVKNSSTDNEALRSITFKVNRNIMPIYLNDVGFKNISTDFALTYGLTNKVLDNLNVIANGTNASNSAAQSSDSANSQLQTDSNTLFTQEDSFKSDMNNAMQNVNNTFRLQDMGTKFVSSAQWVRTQYERLTNNTPFASLITFSLITGLALILLGKVYK